MTFITNIFLWLLPLISIPIIIHLLNRKKIVQIEFSSIQFLEKLKLDSIKRINILQWLLLIIRTLIILLIVLMMSRPILKGYFPFIKVDPNSSLSIVLIDDSYSLHGFNNDIDRKEFLYKSYIKILNAIDDHSKLCVITLSGGVLYDGIKIDIPELYPLIQITNKEGNLYKYIKIIQEKFSKSTIINKELFIVTDGQASLFRNLSKDDFHNIELYFILADKLQDNLKINNARVTNDIIIKDKLLEVEVSVENNGLIEVKDRRINIFVNGINVGLQNITVNVNEVKNFYFSIVLPNHHNNSIKVSISEDDNLIDNTHYINVYLPEKIKILSVYSDINNIKYISSAIDAINNKDILFQHSKLLHTDISFEVIKNKDIVVVYDYEIIKFYYNIFEEYLHSNKHLIIIPKNLDKLDFLYGLIKNIDSDEGEYVELKSGTYEQISYEYILHHQNSPNLFPNDIKVVKYIEKKNNFNSVIHLNQSNSFWDRFIFENSLIDIFYSSLHLGWNNFPIKGIFIEFVKELLSSNNSHLKYNKYIDQSFLIDLDESYVFRENIVHKNPNSNILPISIRNRKVYIDNLLDIGIHNFYSNDYLIYSIAVNANQNEKKSKLLDIKKIQSKFNVSCYFLNPNDNIALFIKNTREGYEIWRYLLWILSIFIIVEMLISNVNRE